MTRLVVLYITCHIPIRMVGIEGVGIEVVETEGVGIEGVGIETPNPIFYFYYLPIFFPVKNSNDNFFLFYYFYNWSEQLA